jgi:hypothetical protein
MITKKNIDKLIKFGGLLVYQVSYFDTIGWVTVVECRTFNEDHAKERFKSLTDHKFATRMDTYFVNFDRK